MFLGSINSRAVRRLDIPLRFLNSPASPRKEFPYRIISEDEILFSGRECSVRDGFNDFWGLPGKASLLVTSEEGRGGAFLSPYFRQEPFVLSRALLVAFTPGKSFWRSGVVCFGWVYDERKRYGEGKEKLAGRGWVRRPCAKDGWQNGGISFYYAWSPGFPLRFEELPYRSSRNGTSDEGTSLCQAV